DWSSDVCSSDLVGFGMNADMNHIGIEPDVFQNINFSRGRPSSVFPVGGQHPHGRPGSQAGRNSGFYLKTAVEEIGLPPADQAGRSIVEAFEIFANGGNGQYPVSDTCVFKPFFG